MVSTGCINRVQGVVCRRVYQQVASRDSVVPMNGPMMRMYQQDVMCVNRVYQHDAGCVVGGVVVPMRGCHEKGVSTGCLKRMHVAGCVTR